ncbi:hypothetical protein [Thalassobacillus pellis]|uniref:hypothetical protein n=1 Tax=Thalassobacillus pellis TaxID=748008 RepID=UPI00195FA46E|nr:hypothetical protein [Thalassobacillus pellis]MBM7553101.1 hypothetical protein [Thalassobacillus pellis]
MIIKHELWKIAKMPIIWFLLLFFIGLNVLISLTNTDFKEDMAVLKDLVRNYGHDINVEMMTDLGDDYEEKVAWVNHIAKHDGKTYEHPSELLDTYISEKPFNEDEMQKLWQYRSIETYYRVSQDIDEFYQKLDLKDSASAIIGMYGMKDAAADTVRDQFQKLDRRLEELIENGEHKHLFFHNKVYEMHELLFEKIGRALIFELMLLFVLITAAVTNYEFENKTAAVSYTAKRGRKLALAKLAAASIAGFFVILVLIGVTFTTYFLTYDYSGLWNVPISTYFNAEMPLPYITWWNLSFLEYLGFFVLFVIIIQYLFMGITFFLSIFMKNTYLVFFCFLIIAGAGVLLPEIAPHGSNFIFYLQYTPYVMVMNPHEWLMGNGPFTIYKTYEAVTIVVWTLVTGSLCALSIRRFKRMQLH